MSTFERLILTSSKDYVVGGGICTLIERHGVRGEGTRIRLPLYVGIRKGSLPTNDFDKNIEEFKNSHQ